MCQAGDKCDGAQAPGEGVVQTPLGRKTRRRCVASPHCSEPHGTETPRQTDSTGVLPFTRDVLAVCPVETWRPLSRAARGSR